MNIPDITLLADKIDPFIKSITKRDMKYFLTGIAFVGVFLLAVPHKANKGNYLSSNNQKQILVLDEAYQSKTALVEITKVTNPMSITLKKFPSINELNTSSILSFQANGTIVSEKDDTQSIDNKDFSNLKEELAYKQMKLVSAIKDLKNNLISNKEYTLINTQYENAKHALKVAKGEVQTIKDNNQDIDISNKSVRVYLPAKIAYRLKDSKLLNSELIINNTPGVKYQLNSSSITLSKNTEKYKGFYTAYIPLQENIKLNGDNAKKTTVMFYFVKNIIDSNNESYIIPKGSIFIDKRKYYVWKYASETGTVIKTRIKTGKQYGDNSIEVIHGISSGDNIVTKTSQKLKNNQHVRNHKKTSKNT